MRERTHIHSYLASKVTLKKMTLPLRASVSSEKYSCGLLARVQELAHSVLDMHESNDWVR